MNIMKCHKNRSRAELTGFILILFGEMQPIDLFSTNIELIKVYSKLYFRFLGFDVRKPVSFSVLKFPCSFKPFRNSVRLHI